MKTKVLLIIFTVLALPTLLFAQEPPPGFDGESPYVVTDVQVPIDDWVIVLVAATIVYGLLQAKAHRKMKIMLK